MKAKLGRLFPSLYLVFALPLFLVVFYKSIQRSFTHDESLSYLSLEGIHPLTTSSNTHPLNSLLMWLFELLLGNSEWILRLPNVLAFAGFLFALFKIISLLDFKWLSIAVVALVAYNPSFLEFFSLARGYGISLTLLSFSLYNLLIAYHNKSLKERIKFFVISLWFAVLACYAHLGLINYLIALIMLITVSSIKHRNTLTREQLKKLLIPILGVIPAIWFLLKLKRHGQLYFGADELTITSISILDRLWPHTHFSPFVYHNPSAALLVFLFLSLLIIVFLKKWRGKMIVSFFLLVFLLFILLIERALFDTKLPVNRTALYLTFLFLMLLIFNIDAVVKKFSVIRLVFIPLILIAFYISINGLRLYHKKDFTNAWMYDADTKAAMKELSNQIKPLRQYTISNNWLYEPSINYYIIKDRLPIKLTDREGISKDSDFIYTDFKDSIPANFKLVKAFSKSGTALYLNKSLTQ